MFTKKITNLTLTSQEANQIFRNIEGNGFDFSEDTSFLATLRALLPKRMPENERLQFLYKKHNISEHNIRGEKNLSAIINWMYGDVDEKPILARPYTIQMYGINATDDTYNLLANKFDDQQDGVEKITDFRELKDIRQFVKDRMDAHFYINEKQRSMAIVVKRPDYRHYHFLQALIPRFLPWYFTDNPVDDEERELLHSLTEKYATKFERIIEEFAKKIDFRQHKIKTLLDSFERRARERQLLNVHDQIVRVNHTINELLDRYSELINDRDRYLVREAGLKVLIESASKESELIDYFMCNKNIDLYSASGHTISIVVKCYFDYFNPESYAHISQNMNADMYRLVSNSIFNNKADIKMLFDAIVSDDPLLKVKMSAYYELDTRGEVRVHQGHGYTQNYQDFVPNPHLQHFACLGNHKRHINEALLSGDLIRAIEQCISSAKSVNVEESPCLSRFVRDVCDSSEPIIELPDGTSVTSADALAWLKQQDDTRLNEEVQNV